MKKMSVALWVVCLSVFGTACLERSSLGFPVDSTMQVLPAAVPADGASVSRIVVTVRLHGAAVPADCRLQVMSQNPTTVIRQPGAADANGQFVAEVTSSVAGTDTLTARLIVGRQTALLPIAGTLTFGAVTPGQSGVPSALTSLLQANPNVVSPDGSSVSVLTLWVRDAGGAPVVGETVSFSSTGSHNLFTTEQGPTDPNGMFTTSLASTVAETKTVTAHMGVAALSTNVIFAEAAPSGALSTLVATPSTQVADGTSSVSLTLTLRDGTGSLMPGLAVAWDSNGANDILGVTSGVTDASGNATNTLRSTQARTTTARATVASVPVTTLVAFVAGSTSNATSYMSVEVKNPAAPADGSTGVTVTTVALDAYGNPVANEVVTLSSSTPGTSFTPVSGPTDANGIFTSVVTTTTAGLQTLHAAIGSTASATAQTTFVPGAFSVSNSTFVANPITLTADGAAATALTLQAHDAYGNTLVGAAVTFSSSGTNNTVSPASGVTDTSGMFAASMRSTHAENKTVTATIGSVGKTTTVTFTADVPSTATSTLTASPTSAIANGVAPTTLTVTIRDAQGNPVSGQAVTLSTPSSQDVFAAATGFTSASGVYTTTLTSTLPEVKTVTATFGTLSITTNVTFVAGPADSSMSSLAVTPARLLADGSTTTAVTVTVQDAQGNPIAGQAVSIASTGTGNTFLAMSGSTSAAGVWSTTLASSVAEVKTLTATIGGFTKTALVTFVVPSGATSSVTATPTSQTADGTSTISITVTANDATSTPISGQPVSLSATGTNYTFAPASGSTNSSGVFTATMTSTIAEVKTVTATLGAVTETTPVTFVAGPPASITLAASPTSQPADGSSSVSVIASVFDAQGNRLSGQPVKLAVSGAAGPFTQTSANTDASGNFSSGLVSSYFGQNTITARSGALSNTAQVQFTTLTPLCNNTFFYRNRPPIVNFAAATYGVATGDFDGDSKLDVATTTGNTVAVMLGKGTGTFATPVTYTTGTGPRVVIAADIDSDGKLDLAVANTSTTTLSVLLGTGTGTFGTPVAYTVGNGPRAMARADVDGDGNMDFITANVSANNISVLLGNAGGTFATAVNYASGSQPVGIAVGEYTGDGVLDVAVLLSAGKLNILPGTGTGTFGARSTVATISASVSDLATFDFNSDGVADLVVLDAFNQGIAVLMGQSGGGFAAAVAYGGTQTSPSHMLLADLDADGKMDISVTNSISNSTAYFAGNGGGSFAARGQLVVAASPTGLAGGDFDGDGFTDLALTQASGLSILPGGSGGNFPNPIIGGAGSTTQSIEPVDINGDGALDFVYTDYDTGLLAVVRGNGAGAFSASTTYAVGTNPYLAAVADFNHDTLPDVAVANYGSGNVSILLGTGAGNLATAVNYNVATNPLGIASADFNGDNILDLVVSNYGSNNVSLLLGTGTGTFGTAVNSTTGTQPKGVAVADFNNDGQLDVVTANWGSANVSVLLANGPGTFATSVSYAAGTNPYGVAVGDFDGDGKMDIAATNSGNNRVSVLLGTGNGTFAAKTDYVISIISGVSGLTVADMNKDGIPDITTANKGDASIGILFGTGSGTFSAVSRYPAGSGPNDITVGDFNKDGKPDMVVANFNYLEYFPFTACVP